MIKYVRSSLSEPFAIPENKLPVVFIYYASKVLLASSGLLTLFGVSASTFRNEIDLWVFLKYFKVIRLFNFMITL